MAFPWRRREVLSPPGKLAPFLALVSISLIQESRLAAGFLIFETSLTSVVSEFSDNYGPQTGAGPPLKR